MKSKKYSEENPGDPVPPKPLGGKPRRKPRNLAELEAENDAYSDQMVIKGMEDGLKEKREKKLADKLGQSIVIENGGKKD